VKIPGAADSAPWRKAEPPFHSIPHVSFLGYPLVMTNIAIENCHL
jgi:hypothetical protein